MNSLPASLDPLHAVSTMMVFYPLVNWFVCHNFVPVLAMKLKNRSSLESNFFPIPILILILIAVENWIKIRIIISTSPFRRQLSNLPRE